MKILVPIRVGMILGIIYIGTYFSTCPHTRGDDPKVECYKSNLENLSPYAWG